MSGTFDEKGTGSDSTDKRPAPTIEGTATEVSVEPGPEDSEANLDDSKTDDATAEALEAGSAGTDETVSDEPEGGAQDEDGADSDGTGDADGDSSAAEAQPVPASEPSGRSFGSRLLGWIGALFTHALAGLAGAVAVLAALTWGYLPISDPQQADRDAIETRIAALESAPKTPDNAAAPAFDPAEIKALAAQVGQLESRLKSMAEAAKDGGSVADAAAISQQVAEAEQRLDRQIQSKIQSEVQSALASGAVTGADDETIEALKSDIADLDAKLKALTAATMSAEEGSNLKP